MPSGPGWRFHAGVLAGAWAFVFLLHPSPGFFWGEYPSVVDRMLPLPATLAGLGEAIRWQATVHTPGLVRPVRALLWWLAAKTLGCDPHAYFVVNGLAVGVAVWAAAVIAWHVTGSRLRAALVAAALGWSYVSVYSLLPFLGFGVSAASALGGTAAFFRSEAVRGRAGRAWQAAGVVLLLGAVLAHETLLALAVVPPAHALLVRRDRAALRRSLAFAAVVPAYALAGWLLARLYGADGGHPILGVLAAAREAPGVLFEFPARVLFTAASGGLPIDPLRALPWFPEFSRLRESLLAPLGLASALGVAAPALGLTALACVRAWADGAGRRRLLFCLVWLAAGTLPLLLPFGGPEAFHTTGALVALFLLWGEAFRRRPGAGRAGTALALALLVLWLGVHGAARWVLFHRDLPLMAQALGELHRVLAEADARDETAGVLFLPIQFGAHYGMLPTVPPLHPGRAGDARGCRRGERQRGCLVEPVWVWSTLRPPPPLPGACREPGALRVGPLTPEIARGLEGSRRMVASRGAGWTSQAPAPARISEWRHLDVCPLPPPEAVRLGGADYRLYRTGGMPHRFWRMSLEPSPRLVPVADCEDDRRPGKP